MDKHRKQNILSNCNQVPVAALNQSLIAGHITFEELGQFGLASEKLAELRLLDDEKNGRIIMPPPIPGEELDDDQIFPPFMPGITTSTPVAKSIRNKTPESILEQIRDNDIAADEIKALLNSGKISLDDLQDIGIEQRVVRSLQFYSTASAITIFKKIEDLPPMESGRTDVYMVGMPFSGKSTILASLIKYANQRGILMHDSYNPDGNRYLETLKRNLDFGILPIRTGEGSYNYIATSLKDSQGTSHPFNIVEVPGENYQKIFNEGVENTELKQFVNYIKSNNKKLLVFVLDAMSHDNRFEDSNLFNALDQSIAYTNILSIFKDSKVLENTDAVYFVVNKFDYIKETRYQFDDRPASELAFDYMNEEFLSLLENCKSARDNSRNKFKIKVLPFSIGTLVYEKIVSHVDDKYPEGLVKHMLEDSFVVRGGAFWRKLF